MRYFLSVCYFPLPILSNNLTPLRFPPFFSWRALSTFQNTLLHTHCASSNERNKYARRLLVKLALFSFWLGKKYCFSSKFLRFCEFFFLSILTRMDYLIGFNWKCRRSLKFTHLWVIFFQISSSLIVDLEISNCRSIFSDYFSCNTLKPRWFDTNCCQTNGVTF